MSVADYGDSPDGDRNYPDKSNGDNAPKPLSSSEQDDFALLPAQWGESLPSPRDEMDPQLVDILKQMEDLQYRDDVDWSMADDEKIYACRDAFTDELKAISIEGERVQITGRLRPIKTDDGTPLLYELADEEVAESIMASFTIRGEDALGEYFDVSGRNLWVKGCVEHKEVIASADGMPLTRSVYFGLGLTVVGETDDEDEDIPLFWMLPEQVEYVKPGSEMTLSRVEALLREHFPGLVEHIAAKLTQGAGEVQMVEELKNFKFTLDPEAIRRSQATEAEILQYIGMVLTDHYDISSFPYIVTAKGAISVVTADGETEDVRIPKGDYVLYDLALYPLKRYDSRDEPVYHLSLFAKLQRSGRQGGGTPVFIPVRRVKGIKGTYTELSSDPFGDVDTMEEELNASIGRVISTNGETLDDELMGPESDSERENDRILEDIATTVLDLKERLPAIDNINDRLSKLRLIQEGVALQLAALRQLCSRPYKGEAITIANDAVSTLTGEIIEYLKVAGRLEIAGTGVFTAQISRRVDLQQMSASIESTRYASIDNAHEISGSANGERSIVHRVHEDGTMSPRPVISIMLNTVQPLRVNDPALGLPTIDASYPALAAVDLSAEGLRIEFSEIIDDERQKAAIDEFVAAIGDESVREVLQAACNEVNLARLSESANALETLDVIKLIARTAEQLPDQSMWLLMAILGSGHPAIVRGISVDGDGTRKEQQSHGVLLQPQRGHRWAPGSEPVLLLNDPYQGDLAFPIHEITRLEL